MGGSADEIRELDPVMPAYLKKKHMKYLAVYRIIAVFWSLQTITWSFKYKWDGLHTIVYLTHWSFTLEMFYIIVGTVHYINVYVSNYDVIKSLPDDSLVLNHLENGPGTKRAHVLAYTWSMVLPLTWIVMTVFWTLAYTPGTEVSYNLVSFHGLNIIYPSLEMFLNNVDVQPNAIGGVYLFSFLYLGFYYVYYRFSGEWVYPAVHLDEPHGIIMCLVILMVTGVYFFFFKFINQKVKGSIKQQPSRIGTNPSDDEGHPERGAGVGKVSQNEERS